METLFVGQHIISKDTVDSTNNVASALLLQSHLPEGTVILAKEQSAGKGQQGATWESEKGKNLLASFILYPAFVKPRNIFDINITVSLAMYDFAKMLLKKNVTVKWPNDLYYENKKIAGLLIENSIRNTEINYSIIGMGINLNQVTFSSNIPDATSLKTILKKELDLQQVFNVLCQCLEARYLQLKANKTGMQRNEYLKSLYRFNTPAKFTAKGMTIEGKIVDVSEDGKLVLENADGKLKAFGFKEIIFTTETQRPREKGK